MAKPDIDFETSSGMPPKIYFIDSHIQRIYGQQEVEAWRRLGILLL